MKYGDRLRRAVLEKGNPCLVGLDPHLELLPEEFGAIARSAERSAAERADAIADFLCETIELVASRAPAVKPQSAFFELLGAPGTAAFERVVKAARRQDLLVIGDVKRGDIGSTSTAYARAFLEPAGDAEPCEAITINPYFGDEGVEPFLEACERSEGGLYVLVRTSNPSSARYQLHGTPPLCDLVAEDVQRWGRELKGQHGMSSVGAVVGATRREELARLRGLMPDAPLLLPGYGAQGARASDVVDAFVGDPRRALVNSSRGVLFAAHKGPHAGKPWRDALLAALDDMIEDVVQALGARA